MPIIKSSGEVNQLTVETEKQSLVPVTEKKKRVYAKKSPSRGGARPNSGRPKGSTNKISHKDFLEEFEKQSGKTFNQFVIESILRAKYEINDELVSRYILGLSKYLMEDTKQVDITSMGQSLVPNFNFPTKEIEDWSDEKN
jgi:hypothetical protein